MQKFECVSIGFRSRLVFQVALGKAWQTTLIFYQTSWCKPQQEKERSIQSLTETCQVALVRYKWFAQPTRKILLSFAINYSKYPKKCDDRDYFVTCSTDRVFFNVALHDLRKKWTNSHFESLHIVNRWTLNKIIVEIIDHTWCLAKCVGITTAKIHRPTYL